ncbi:MAG: outer membrane protein assembly factor BamA [Myxococcota bacterium]|jgi:outer membrane protein insertion porin family
MIKDRSHTVRSTSLLAAFFAAAVAIAYATPAGAGMLERSIAGVDIEGNRRVEAAAVMADIKSLPGTVFNEKTVAEDIRRIFQSGLFKDVNVYSRETDKGLVLVFEVVEQPTVSRIDVKGNDEIDREDIDKVIDIKPNTILDERKIKKVVGKIHDLYIDKGFYLSETTYSFKPIPETNEVELTFEINEYSKVMVKKITLLGNRNLPDSDILGVLETQEGGWLSFITSSGQYKEEAFQRDLMRIQQLYRDRGYIKIKVNTPLLALSPDKKYMYISISMEEGDQYRVGTIDFKGDLDILGGPEKLKKLFKKIMGTRTGDIFSVSQFFHKDLTRIADIYKDDGYAWANVNTPYEERSEKVKDKDGKERDQKIIDLVLDVQKGPQCHFESIEIVGNNKTRDRVIRRELRIYEKDLFSNTGIEISKARVNALGFFEKVEITYRRGNADNQVVVLVEVKEKPTGTFQVGAGFSSVENFLFQAQVAQYNLFGRGHSLSLTAQISSIRKLFDLSFVEPYFLDTKWTFAIDLYNTNWDYYEFQRASTGGRVTFGHPIPHFEDLKAFVTYTLEWVEINSGTSIEREVRIKNMYQRGITSSLTGKLVYDTRNNRILPTSGMYHTASAEIASRYLGSDNEFVRTFLTGRFYFPLPWGIVTKLNLNLGYITTFGSSTVPISERFYVGGVNSLRGYTLRTISPSERVARRGIEPDSDLFDFLYGGNKQLTVNFEIEIPIIEKLGIKAVLFVDAGNSYSEDENFFQDYDYDLPIGLLYSAGFGLRWFSPIGPLRFEWGFPLTRRPNKYYPGLFIDDPYKFEFTIGNFF